MKTLKSKTIVALAAISCGVWLAACSDPTAKNNPDLKPENQSGRMKVTSAQTIRDAKGNTRDILVIKDSETGSEYLAVMGAGVQEMVTRTHSTGKSTWTSTTEE